MELFHFSNAAIVVSVFTVGFFKTKYWGKKIELLFDHPKKFFFVLIAKNGMYLAKYIFCF